MASAVVRVKSVNISGTHLTTNQVNTLWRAVKEEEEDIKKLETLNMSEQVYLDLSDVDSQLLANAVVRVKSVDISDIHLTPDQVNTLCRTITEEENLVLEDLVITRVTDMAVQQNVKDWVREKLKKVIGL